MSSHEENSITSIDYVSDSSEQIRNSENFNEIYSFLHNIDV